MRASSICTFRLPGQAMVHPPPKEMLTSIRIPQVSLEKAGYFEIVDQLALPHSIRWEPVLTAGEAWQAIKLMKAIQLSPFPREPLSYTSLI
jgi:hypothetical protein